MSCRPFSTNELPLEFLDKNKIIQSFSRAADHYDHFAVVQKTVRGYLLERLDYLTLQPKRILDVGTGTGQTILALKQKYPDAELYGVDIALPMLSRAQTLTSAYWITADAEQLPLADNSVDLIISNLTLQWCTDIAQVFSEFARILTPEGAVFFSTFGPDTLKELRYSWAQVDNKPHINHFIDMHHIGDCLLQAGLTQAVTDTEWYTDYHKEVTAIMKELKTIGAHNAMVGRSRGLLGKQAFNTLLAEYEQFRAENGLLPVTYEVIYGHTLGKTIPVVAFQNTGDSTDRPIFQMKRRPR